MISWTRIVSRSRLLAVAAVALLLMLNVTLASTVVIGGKGGGGKPQPPADPAIAFYHQTSGPNPNRIMVMNSDGTNKATIYEAYFSIFGNPSWSSDGASIAWAGRTGGNSGVWRIDVSVVDGEPVGSNLQQLVSDEDCGFCIDAAWSPSGNEIVVAKSPSGPGQDTIFVVPSTGGAIQTIYTSPDGSAMIRSPSWDSNGNRIAFAEIEVLSLDWYIKILNRWTGEVSQSMFKGEFTIRTLDWARQDTDTLVIDDESAEEILTLDISTETATYVVDGLQPGWSPDNSEIVYVSTGRKSAICTIELSNGKVTKLNNGGYVPGWRLF